MVYATLKMQEDGRFAITYADDSYNGGYTLEGAIAFCEQYDIRLVTKETLAVEAAKRAQPAEETWHGWKLTELEKAFDLVKNAEDWKAPIEAQIPGRMIKVVLSAIEFYTATSATVDHLKDGICLVRSVGYRAGPAGP